MNISEKNIITIENKRIKPRTPFVKVNGFYMPVVPENLLSVTGNSTSNNLIDIDVTSVKTGTPCVLVNGVTIPLMPFSETHEDDEDDKLVAFYIPQIGWFEQEEWTFHNPNDWHDMHEVIIWSAGGQDWLMHPYLEFHKESPDYMYLIYNEVYSHPEYPYDAIDISYVYRCSKSNYNTVGAVWERISSLSWEDYDTLTVTECVYK